MIHIDKASVSEDRLEEAINYLRLMLGDDSHIPSVDAQEQREIEPLLDAIMEEEKKVVVKKTIKYDCP
jgi:hypothetical protein